MNLIIAIINSIYNTILNPNIPVQFFLILCFYFSVISISNYIRLNWWFKNGCKEDKNKQNENTADVLSLIISWIFICIVAVIILYNLYNKLKNK